MSEGARIDERDGGVPGPGVPAATAARRSPEAPLRLRGVRYRYAGAASWALEGVDLDVGAGEVVGVVGPNDAGKTTLCLVAAGLAPAVVGGTLEGSVRLIGQETADLRPHEAAQRAGIVFQHAATQLSGTAPTVWEEVAFGPRNLGLPLAVVIERVESSLAAVRIADLAPRDPTRLSGGQAQLLAIASVLAMRPACLILDEPTSQLDPRGTELVGEAIAALARSAEAAVLLVEHKTDLVAALASRVVALSKGSVVRSGSAASVLGDPVLPELGVEPPAAVRLRAGLDAAGLDEGTRARALEALRLELGTERGGSPRRAVA